MPANRGVKRTASKAAEAKSLAAGSSKSKKKTVAAAKHIEEVPPQKKLGQVLTCGSGDVGQLGHGEDILEKSRFTIVSALGSNIVDICAGGMHTVCIDNNGDVWTFGCNDEGALGRSTAEDASTEWIPTKVKLPGKTIKVSAGDSHTAALLQSGKVYAWGSFRDSHGNMGLTLKGNERVPIEMLPGHKVVQIASGGDHLVMLTDIGQIFTCGCGEQGQLGRVTARSCDRNSRGGLNPLLSPAPLIFRPRDKMDFNMIWAGTHCTFAREASKGEIYSWGLNNYDQIGVDTKNGKLQTIFTPVLSEAFAALKDITWTKIAAGPHHTLILDSEGICYALGRREYGRLGLGENCEDAKTLTPVPLLSDKKCTQIACGTAASFAVTDSGDIYAWGMGTSGQLGTGSETDEETPQLLRSKQVEGRLALNVSAGGQHTVLLVQSIEQPEDKIKETTKETDKSETTSVDNKSEEVTVDIASKNEEAVTNQEAEKSVEKMVTDPDTDTKKQEDEIVSTKKPARRGRKGSTSSTASTESTRSTKAAKNKHNGALSTVKEIQEVISPAETEPQETPMETDAVPPADGTQQKDDTQESLSNQKLKRKSDPEEADIEAKRIKIDSEENLVKDNPTEVVDAPVERVEEKSVVNTEIVETLTNGNKDADTDKSTDNCLEKTPITEVAEPKCASLEAKTESSEGVTSMETETAS